MSALDLMLFWPRNPGENVSALCCANRGKLHLKTATLLCYSLSVEGVMCVQ